MASYLDRFGPAPDLDAKPAQGADTIRRIEMGRAVQEAQKSESPENLNFLGQAADVGKSFGAGLGRGIAATPGIVGDIGMLGTYAPVLGSYAKERAKEFIGVTPQGTALADYEKRIAAAREGMTEAEKTGRYSTMFGYNVPTGQYFVEKATPYVPGLTYEGKTGAGRVAGTVGEFVGSSATTRGAGSALRRGLGAGKDAIVSKPAIATDVGAGLGSGTAGETFRGSPDEVLAQIGGALPGAVAGRLTYSRMSPDAARERGERIAGDVLRQQIRDPDAVQSASQRGAPLLEGVEPTTPQLLREEPGIAALSRELAAKDTPGMYALGQQQARSQEALTSGARTAAEMAEGQKLFPSMADAFGLPAGDNPRVVSSMRAQQLFNAVEEPLYKAAQETWKHPAFASAVYDKGAVRSAVTDALNSVTDIGKKQMPSELRGALDVITKYKGYGVPFAEIQEAKKIANAIIRSPDANKSAAIEVTKKLDDLLTDPKNLSAKSPAGFDAPQAFQAARAATRQYKTLFDTDLMKPLAERKGADYAIQAEQMLDRVFGGSQNALARYRELQAVPGLDISGPAADWIVSKITKNGMAAVTTPDDVARFMREPGNAALVNEIPGLKDRLDNIVRQSRTEQVQQSFANAMESNDPAKLAAYMKANKGVLNEVFTDPAQRNYLSALERSANVLKTVPTGQMLDRRTFDKLMQGDLFTLLHGKATGKFIQYGTGALAGAKVGSLVGPLINFELAGALSAGAGLATVAPKVRAALSTVVYGTTREQAIEALSRAMRDPEYMKLLTSKPTIENQMSLLRSLVPAAATVAPGAAMGTRELLPKQEKETTEQAFERLVREGKINPENVITVRPQRASGGRLGNGIAESLMRAADRAKRELSRETEALLEKPDEHIAKALEIAKKHI